MSVHWPVWVWSGFPRALGDRKDYYEAETDFYKAIRSILGERQNSEFSNAIKSVHDTLDKLQAGKGSMDEQERTFLI